MSLNVHGGKLVVKIFHGVVGVALWKVCVEVKEDVGCLVSGGGACKVLVVDEAWRLIGV